MSKEEVYNIKLPKEAHQRLKILAAFTGKSMASIAARAIEYFYKGTNLPEPDLILPEYSEFYTELYKERGAEK